jgi:multicomponent Na+:H+ antiporter subunit B
MKFLVLRTATKFLLVLMLLYSVFILFRGHDKPGGGFIAGLITASAYGLYLMAHGPVEARKLIFIDLRYLLAIGIGCALGSGFIGLICGKNFLTGIWFNFHFADTTLALGTPQLLDIGVYITVVTSILMTMFALEEK